MNIKRIFSAVLMGAAALLLVSCGGLASSRNQTGDFTFTVDPALAETIARNAGSGNLTIKITVKSTDSTSYTPAPIEKTAIITSGSADEIMTAVTGMSFEFTNVPFNIEMNLDVVIKVDGITRFLSQPQKFTLTKNGISSIEAVLNHVFNTPIVLLDNTDDAYYRMTTLSTDENNTLIISDTPVDNDLSEEELYCVDPAGVIYHTEKVENENHEAYYCIFAYPLSGTPTQCPVTFEGFGEGDSLLHGICYDPIQNKVVVIILNENEMSSYDGYTYQFTPGTLPEELELTPSTPGVTKLAKNPYFDNLSEADPALCLYAFNGRLYSLLSYDNSYYIAGEDTNETNPSITLRVQSLNDGSLIKDATVTIPDTHSDIEGYLFGDSDNDGLTDNVGTEYKFNDMYVDEDNVYILFHQLEVARENGHVEFSIETAPSAEDWIYIDRGGIIVLDKNTLTQKTVIASPEIKTSMDNLPLRIRNSSGYPNAYADSALTINRTVSIPVTWAVAEPGKGFLANPQKIVAIKPKKLIIADSGAFMYSIDDYWIENGITYCSRDYTVAKTKTATRLVEVDLESFAVREVAKIASDADLYEYTMPDRFTMAPRVGIEIGETVCGHALNQVPYNGGTAYEILSGASSYNNDYSLIAEVVFGNIN